MTLQQLGEQYLKQADELHSLVRCFSARAKNMGGIELYEMNSKITILREMERDTRIIGRQLTEYYDKKEVKKPYKKHLTI